MNMPAITWHRKPEFIRETADTSLLWPSWFPFFQTPLRVCPTILSITLETVVGMQGCKVSPLHYFLVFQLSTNKTPIPYGISGNTNWGITFAGSTVSSKGDAHPTGSQSQWHDHVMAPEGCWGPLYVFPAFPWWRTLRMSAWWRSLPCSVRRVVCAALIESPEGSGYVSWVFPGPVVHHAKGAWVSSSRQRCDNSKCSGVE